MERRALLRAGGVLLLWAPCAGVLRLMDASRSRAAAPASSTVGPRWGMVIDLGKCRTDCTACLQACRRENNVARHGDARWDIHWIRKVEIRSKHSAAAPEKSVPLLCNHCEHPPCAQVCPVQATYRRRDGIVIVDHHRCIGCRYCMIACPYNARFFNFKENEEWPNKDHPRRSHGVAESCTFCAHRLDRGEPPACVQACREAGPGALLLGDLNDPRSEVSRLISGNSVKRIREDLGTEPKVYYLGL